MEILLFIVVCLVSLWAVSLELLGEKEIKSNCGTIRLHETAGSKVPAVLELCARHLIIVLHDHQSQFAFLEIQTRNLGPSDREGRDLN